MYNNNINVNRDARLIKINYYLRGGTGRKILLQKDRRDFDVSKTRIWTDIVILFDNDYSLIEYNCINFLINKKYWNCLISGFWINFLTQFLIQYLNDTFFLQIKSKIWRRNISTENGHKAFSVVRFSKFQKFEKSRILEKIKEQSNRYIVFK